MPDRHQHDEFFRALIFSMIINFLIIFTLVAQRSGKNPKSFQPVIVSIEANHPALPRASSPTGRAIAVAAPAKATKTTEANPRLLMPRPSVAPDLLSEKNAEERTKRPVAPVEAEGIETVLPVSVVNGTVATSAPPDEMTGGTSLLGDTRASDYDTAPERLADEKPLYPEWARRHGWEGTVLLTLSINAYGQVEGVDVTGPSGYESLDRSARESVLSWRFKPARRNGIAVAATVQLPVIFNLTLAENIR